MTMLLMISCKALHWGRYIKVLYHEKYFNYNLLVLKRCHIETVSNWNCHEFLTLEFWNLFFHGHDLKSSKCHLNEIHVSFNSISVWMIGKNQMACEIIWNADGGIFSDWGPIKLFRSFFDRSRWHLVEFLFQLWPNQNDFS